jgi:hypothetical protein
MPALHAKIDMSLIDLDESQSPDAMESNFMEMKELDNTMDDQGAFLMHAYEHQRNVHSLS